MVNAPAAGLAALFVSMAIGPASAQAPSVDRDPSRAVGSALGKGDFPWYDPTNDRAKPLKVPITAPASPASSSGRWGWLRWAGDAASLVVFAVALAALIGLIFWFWRLYEPSDPGEGPGSTRGRGEPSRIEALPAGMRKEFDSADPWEEAIRRRDRGDLAGAVVCLFAHQLLTLSRLGLVRLAPGRTGRQLLRSVADAEFRTLASPTLRVFEAVYYGHRDPTLAEFTSLWEQAEAFERRVAGAVVA